MLSLFDALLPHRCAYCKGLLSLSSGPFCNDCRSQIKFSNENESSLFAYAGLIRELILSAKFKPDESVARILARFLYATIKNEELPIFSQSYDFVAYVPSHYRRRLSRGYELPAILGQAIARYLKKPLQHPLVCSRFDPPLSKAPSAIERLAKVNARYRLARNSWKPSLVLLVDDVVTTGATLQSAAQVLIDNGHCVKTFAFAKTLLTPTASRDK